MMGLGERLLGGRCRSDGMGALGEVWPLAGLSLPPASRQRPSCAPHPHCMLCLCPGASVLKLRTGAEGQGGGWNKVRTAAGTQSHSAGAIGLWLTGRHRMTWKKGLKGGSQQAAAEGSHHTHTHTTSPLSHSHALVRTHTYTCMHTHTHSYSYTHDLSQWTAVHRSLWALAFVTSALASGCLLHCLKPPFLPLTGPDRPVASTFQLGANSPDPRRRGILCSAGGGGGMKWGWLVGRPDSCRSCEGHPMGKRGTSVSQ